MSEDPAPEGRPSLAQRFHNLRKKSILDAQPLKEASDSEELAVSLKRYPDTKPEFFRELFQRWERGKDDLSPGGRTESSLTAAIIIPCKWLNLTRMVEISHPSSCNFSSP